MNSTTLPEDPQQLQRLRETLLEWTSAQHQGAGLTSAERYAVLAGLLGPDLCSKLGVYRIPDGFKLSVVIPVYNEVKTIETVLARVRDVAIPCEIICVDDGSRDGTRDLLTRLGQQPQPEGSPLRVILHEKNQGKGAAIRTGFLQVTGDVVVIQDADMEYDPQDFRILLQPILADEADVAYGSRFSHNDGPILHFWHTLGNQFISFLASLRWDKRFSDVETCYKMVRRSLIDEIAPTLQEKRFGVELELTAKLARKKGVRFVERPIQYAGRSYAEGKKIGWRDGISAMRCILKY